MSSSAATGAGIGQPVLRREDIRLLTGKGSYSDDQRDENQAFGVVLRSPHAHARIRSIDASAARAMPGVLAVLTGTEMEADGLKPVPNRAISDDSRDIPFRNHDGHPVVTTLQTLLPRDKVRFVGEAVAFVVAETVYQARDAAEAVIIDYDMLPAVVSAREAAEPDAPILWEAHGSNVFIEVHSGDHLTTEAAFARAAHVVRLATHCQRVTGVPMEPRATLGTFDPMDGSYLLRSGSGGVHRQRDSLAGVLNINPDTARVIHGDVGGSFGTRNNFTPESGLVCWASRRVGRPVKWTSDRSECFASDYQGRDLDVVTELALDAEGRILGLRSDNVGNLGSHTVSMVSLRKSAGLMTGNYRVPAAFIRSRAVVTNTVPTTSYRSAGRPEAIFIIERLLDLAADKIGLDRLEIRRRNVLRDADMPYRTPLGITFDSGDYGATMEKALALMDHAGFAARKAASAQAGRLRGFGIANYVEVTTGSPRERAEVTVRPDGHVDLIIGTQSTGQGHETSFAQLIDEWLGIPIEKVRFIQGDTASVSFGGGTQSGRSMRMAGIVVGEATTQLLAKAREAAAELLEVRTDDLAFDRGSFTVQGTDRSIDLFALAAAMDHGKGLPAHLHGALGGTGDVTTKHAGFPFGAAACEVEVDPETGQVELVAYGAVDDVGRAVNPMILHGQTHGGAAQGIGQALWEHCLCDKYSGQVLTGSFQDYGMPRAGTLPSFRTEIAETPSPNNPLGIRSGGEGGTTPALAVIIGAIVDALKERGVRHIEMPATPLRVWQAIQAAANR